MQGLEDHCFRFTSDELFNGLPAQLEAVYIFVSYLADTRQMFSKCNQQ